jgi:hypothetical protein
MNVDNLGLHRKKPYLPGEAWNMKSQIRQSLHASDGKGMVGCMVFIVLMGIAIFLSITLIPIYYTNYTMESETKIAVSRAGAHYLDDAAIAQDVLDIARKNEIQVEKKNIKVRRFAGQIFVEVDYTIPVDFGILERNLDFKIKASSVIGTL